MVCVDFLVPAKKKVQSMMECRLVESNGACRLTMCQALLNMGHAWPKMWES